MNVQSSFQTICVTAAIALVASSVFGQADQAPPPLDTDTGADVEVALRGPIHEAFATPLTHDPVEPFVIDRQSPELLDELPPDHKPVGNNIVWIPGYWAFDPVTDDFLWISGLWRDVPPGRRWVPGHWIEQESRFTWSPGFWVDATQTEVAYTPAPPRSQEVGPNSTAPSANHFWVPGCYRYQNNRWRWRTGYWAPHQRDWVWVPARYTPTPAGYVYTDGYWDYGMADRGVAFAPVRLRTSAGRGVRAAYSPRTVINTSGQLRLHLFVNVASQSYCFGDYYDKRFAARGIQPWFEFHQRRGCYDSLYTYYTWRFGADYDKRLRGWNRYFATRPEVRPRLTIEDQLAFANEQAGNQHLAQSVLSLPIADAAKSGDYSLQPLSMQQRIQIRTEAAASRTAVLERRTAYETVSGLTVTANRAVSASDQPLSLPTISRAELVPVQAPDVPIRLQSVAPDLPTTGTPRVPAVKPRLPAIGASKSVVPRNVTRKPGRKVRNAVPTIPKTGLPVPGL